MKIKEAKEIVEREYESRKDIAPKDLIKALRIVLDNTDEEIKDN